MNEEIFEILRAKLNLSNRANIDGGQTLTDLKLPLITDQIIEDDGKIFFVEIKSRVTIDAIAGLGYSGLDIAKAMVDSYARI
jgi:hypothetical protein